ncbi:MAG: serine--tRNA ligase [Oligoflexales bacterium]
MLDIQFIRENPEHVEKSAAHKHFPINASQILELDKKNKNLLSEVEDLRAQRNQISKQIPKSSSDERPNLIKEVSDIKAKLEDMTPHLRETKEKLHELLLKVPQPARDDVPIGKSDEDNVEIKKVGIVPKFSFTPKNHIEIGEALGILDFKRGVKIAGARSWLLIGDGARLEQALMRYVWDYLHTKNYTPVTVPVLVQDSMMEGTGYFPGGHDQAYRVEQDGVSLVGTGEVPLCGIHSDEVLNKEDLPIRFMTQSSCFRREAGSYGKTTRGLYRVHQFTKTEMLIIAPADKELSEKLHDELLGNAEHIVTSLGLPYRVVYVCTGDLGQGQVRKHDIETWMPGRENYGETHSCSTFYDFQARRLNIRYNNEDGEKTFAYTLNNTACANPRIILAILENCQTKDGHVRIPEVLRPYMGGQELIKKRT